MERKRQNKLLKAALHYHTLGFSVIPIKPKDKKALIPWKKYQTKKASVDRIKIWWKKWPDANIGIVTGAISGIDVIDIDSKEAFEKFKEKLPKGLLTPTVKSPNGLHIYLKHTKGLRVGVGVFDTEGIDLRAEGGYIIAPPSVGENGKPYKWREGKHLKDVKLVTLPPDKQAELMQVHSSTMATVSTGYRDEKGRIDPDKVLAGRPEGEREAACWEYACSLRSKGSTSREDAEKLVLRACRACDPPLSEKIAMEKVEYAWKYYSYMGELNKKHAVIRVGESSIRVLTEYYNPEFERNDIAFWRKSDFYDWYAPQKTLIPDKSGELKEVPIAKAWFGNKNRRQYEGVVLAPGEIVEGYYNLWKGFAVEPKQGDWSLMRKHVGEVVCNRNKVHFKYIMDWMARNVQDPGQRKEERPGVAVVLKGAEGSGKGIFARTYGELFGVHFRHLTDSRHVTGRFNVHFKDCIFCYVDEAIWGGDKTASGILKGMITERTIMCEAKGKDPFTMKNHINFIMASNEIWNIPAGKAARRYLALEVPDGKIADFGYFEKIMEQMDNGGREAMLYDLLNRDISKTNLKNVPRTKELFRQQEQSLEEVGKFWFNCLLEGELTEGFGDWKEVISIKELYDEFLSFCDTLGKKTHRPTKSEFGTRLKVYVPSRHRTPRVLPNEGRVLCYLIPPLEDCRGMFEKALHTKVKWDEIVEQDEDGRDFKDVL